MSLILKLLLALSLGAAVADAVDRNIFKTCSQSSFCRRCRKLPAGAGDFYVRPVNITLSSTWVTAELRHRNTSARFSLELRALRNNTFRLRIDERDPLRPRHHVDGVLKAEPVPADNVKITQDPLALQIVIRSGKNRAILQADPFKVDLYADGKLVVSANADGLMRFEHLRERNSTTKPGDGAETDPDAWEETFRGHRDSKPLGPEAVALDFRFPGARHAYGIPEHADTLALRNTRGSEPYRLYNLDVFEHEVGERMSLYGAVPVVYAHGDNSTAGVFWLNTAETWVDIASRNVTSNASDVSAHFMSESGIIDAFFLLGPEPMDVFRQYTILTGTANLPPMFALGYHQSRWNYDNQTDVLAVSQGFDTHGMPMDVMWLDIEHTDGKRYFTWNPQNFSDPVTMVRGLVARGRKLVVIVDPHIKRDPNYFLHGNASSLGYYIKTRNGSDYVGESWPGQVSYMDFFDQKVREYYAGLFDFSKFIGTSPAVHIWNDMNEPSCLSGPEVTIPKDLVHVGGWEHRDVHNAYGFRMHSATYDGLVRRTRGAERPFILTRSFFAGSQRYTAVWTGDNAAEWSHLRVSYAECLSLAIAGISFCGSDVGGYAGNPTSELFVRWYQAGAWLPFFRAHAEISTKRREPWLFGDEVAARVRNALRQRYSYLPYWYALFREHEVDGTPVIRPIWAHYPKETQAFAIDDELLVGDAMLVKPVFEPGARNVSVYFPGEGKVLWWDSHTMELHGNVSRVTVPVTMDRIPVYQRAGSIVPRKLKLRPSTQTMRSDPYTLSIVLNASGVAQGRLYIDDETSFAYRNGEFINLELRFENVTLSAKKVDGSPRFKTRSVLKRVDIVNLKQNVGWATVMTPYKIKTNVKLQYNKVKNVVTLNNLKIDITDEWTIKLIDSDYHFVGK